MKSKPISILAILMLVVTSPIKAQTTAPFDPIIDSLVIFGEKNGMIVVEAEHFYLQSKSDVRQWYRTSKNERPVLRSDKNNHHFQDASNKAFVEILPDTRVTHSDELIVDENFTNESGQMGIIHYRVAIDEPGRYYVWVRAYSTGTEDNGIHVGLNGSWPEHGQRMQWCDGKNQWTWGSKQRTEEEHCGVPKQIYLDIEEVGVHDIQFSMREDGFEFDKFLLTKDIAFVPHEKGPKVYVAEGVVPTASNRSYFERISISNSGCKVIAAQDFFAEESNFYKHGSNWLAINPERYKEAKASATFNFESGIFDVVFVGVGENDGQSTFTILINGQEIASYKPPLGEEMFEEGYNFNALWEKIAIQKGDIISVIAKVGTDGKEFTRGRWAGIVFAPVGQGKQIQDAPSSYTAE